MVPCSNGGANAMADIGSSTCSSVSLVSGKACGAARRPRQFTDVAVSSAVMRDAAAGST